MRLQRLAHFALLALLASLVLSFRSPSAHAAQELRIGIALDKPPYILAGGRSGLEVEIVERVLTTAGYKVVFESYPPARSLGLMRIGRLDGMMTVDEGVGLAGHFSDEYITYRNVAITLKRRNIQLHQLEDLRRHSVAAFQNARLILTPAFTAAVAAHPEYREYAQQISQNRLLYAGRVDVVVGDRLVFRALNAEVEKGIDTTQPVVVHELFPSTPRKMVFRDARVRDAFNAGLAQLKADGGYAAIEARYSAWLKP